MRFVSAVAVALCVAGCTCTRAPGPGSVQAEPSAQVESPEERLARLRAAATAASEQVRDASGLREAIAAWERVEALAPSDPGAARFLARASWLAGAHAAADPAEARRLFSTGLAHAEVAMAAASPAFVQARAAGRPFAGAISDAAESAGGAFAEALRWYLRNQLAWARAGGRVMLVAQRPLLQEGIAGLEALGLRDEARLLEGELLAALPVAAGGDRGASRAALVEALDLLAGDGPTLLRVALAWPGDEERRREHLQAAAASQGEGIEAILARERAKLLLE